MYDYKVKNGEIDVIDGDTIKCTIDLGLNIYTRQKMRLVGINTPEIRTNNVLEKKAGLIVKSIVEKYIENAEDIVIYTAINSRKNEKLGKYGRYLVVLKCSNQQSLNYYLLLNGYALCYGEKWTDDQLENIISNWNEIND